MVYLVFFLVYLSLGALVFGSMEQPVETQLRIEIRNRIQTFLYDNPSLAGLLVFFLPKFII